MIFTKTKSPDVYKWNSGYIIVYCGYYTKIYLPNSFIYILYLYYWKYDYCIAKIRDDLIFISKK